MAFRLWTLAINFAQQNYQCDSGVSQIQSINRWNEHVVFMYVYTRYIHMYVHTYMHIFYKLISISYFFFLNMCKYCYLYIHMYVFFYCWMVVFCMVKWLEKIIKTCCGFIKKINEQIWYKITKHFSFTETDLYYKSISNLKHFQ